MKKRSLDITLRDGTHETITGYAVAYQGDGWHGPVALLVHNRGTGRWYVTDITTGHMVVPRACDTRGAAIDEAIDTMDAMGYDNYKNAVQRWLDKNLPSPR